MIARTFSFLALGLPALPAQAVIERELVAMGTGLTIVAEAPTRDAALAASEAALRAIEAVEARLSVWRAASDVSRVNAGVVGRPVDVDAETVADLRWAFGFGERVHGAFDATVGPVITAYGLREQPRWPGEAARRSATAAVGAGFFDLATASITRRHREAALDCDAFGKGIALDRALAAATAAGAGRVWLDLGGQVLHGGRDAEATAITIADPDDRSRPARTVILPVGCSAATSGNGERGSEVDGRALGHLLDPRTGQPAADFGSVTVIAPNAALADAAATALFVLGPERGPAVAAELEIQAIYLLRTDR